MLIEPALHHLENVLMLPSLDPSLVALGAVVLDGTVPASLGRVAVHDQAFFLARVGVGKPFTGRTNVNILLGDVAEVLLVPQNMTGASGLKSMNYLATLAPHDGTYVGMISEGLPSLQAVGMAGVQFDAAKFNWLGAIAPTDETVAVWHTAGITTFDGARHKDVVTGATARGSITYTFPALLNELFGSRFKLVTGYNGGTEINLAMERGEVEARNNTWSSWKATKPAWLNEHKISIILQSGPRPADLDAPVAADLANNPDDRRLIELVLSGGALGRPLATTPDVPPERVAALRAAFDETVKDPEFLAEAKALNFDVDPIHGVDMQTTVERILAAPPDVTRRAKHLLE